jgi:hypothetical protein
LNQSAKDARRIRTLEQQIARMAAAEVKLAEKVAEQGEIIRKLRKHRQILAYLSADTPQFFGPMEALAAKQLRDDVLKEAADGRNSLIGAREAGTRAEARRCSHFHAGD